MAFRYVAFAVDMFGAERAAWDADAAKALRQPLYDDRQRLRARLQAALDAVPGPVAKAVGPDTRIDGDKIGAIGYCFGGLCALDLARMNPKGLKGVVSFHGILDGGGMDVQETSFIEPLILVLHGGDDPFVSEEQEKAFRNDMYRREAPLEFVRYQEALHAFSRPEKTSPADIEAGFGYNYNIDRDSWYRMKQFLMKVFGDASRDWTADVFEEEE